MTLSLLGGISKSMMLPHGSPEKARASEMQVKTGLSWVCGTRLLRITSDAISLYSGRGLVGGLGRGKIPE